MTLFFERNGYEAAKVGQTMSNWIYAVPKGTGRGQMPKQQSGSFRRRKASEPFRAVYRR
jgi:hypothetical protein